MPKTARLDLRLDPEHKALIERAARISGASVSEFVVAHALEASRRVLAEHQRVEQIQVTEAAFERLVAELERPARVVPELLEALKKVER